MENLFKKYQNICVSYFQKKKIIKFLLLFKSSSGWVTLNISNSIIKSQLHWILRKVLFSEFLFGRKIKLAVETPGEQKKCGGIGSFLQKLVFLFFLIFFSPPNQINSPRNKTVFINSRFTFSVPAQVCCVFLKIFIDIPFRIVFVLDTPCKVRMKFKWE